MTQIDAHTSPTKGRLAPSPTGHLHVGNAFSFLMAWLSATSQHGKLVLRMEDIDPERSQAVLAKDIIEDLAWLGLDWTEGVQLSQTTNSPALMDTGAGGPYEQSRRTHLYEAALRSLQQRGLVYPCFCSRKDLRTLATAPHIGDEGVSYPGTCRLLTHKERDARIRSGKHFSLRLDTEKALASLLQETGEPATERISFTDAVLGPQSFSLADCGGDFALMRSDGVFAYQLAVSVDDATMGITEVVRGEDLLLSTLRQILLLRLSGATPPRYAHIPLVRDNAGELLAKRHKSLELRALRAAGVSPKSIIGMLAFMAGLQDEPIPATPQEIVPFFRFDALKTTLRCITEAEWQNGCSTPLCP